jgi:thiamine biosynthesis lipoprotein
MVLPQLEASGYTESIEGVRKSVRTLEPVTRAASYRNIVLGADRTVLFPVGSRVDLGGLVKGWAVDRAARHLNPAGNWVINAGGDLLARGEGPDGAGWLVGVEDPFRRQHDIATLSIRDAAVATSSTMRRRWTTTDGEAHHLIDPRTGRPSKSDLVSATVVAETALRAEALAKQLLLQGLASAREFAETRRVGAVFSSQSGAVYLTSAIEGAVVA